RSGGDRPIDRKVRIVPGDAKIVAWRVITRHLVKDLGVRFERAEPMCKADRDQQLLAVLGRQLLGNPTAITRRRAPQIDRDIENTPAQHTDKLVLRGRWSLKMESPQRPGHDRLRLIVLH